MGIQATTASAPLWISRQSPTQRERIDELTPFYGMLMSPVLTQAALDKRYVKPGPPGRGYHEFPDLPQAPAVSVPVVPSPEARQRECFYNVRDACEAFGGDIVFGWAIWIWPLVNIEAIHHAVWRRPDGEVVDVTPPELKGPAITFVEDASTAFDLSDALAEARQIKTHWLITSPAGETYRKAYDEVRRLDQALGDYLKKVRSTWRDANAARDAARAELLLEIASKCGTADPCFCDSGRPFSACCASNFGT